MPTKGKSYSPNFATHKLVPIINSLGEQFTRQEVLFRMAEAAPEISASLVGTILVNKVNQGVFTREGDSFRKVANMKFEMTLPKALVAESLWEVLLEKRAKPVHNSELTILTEQRVAKRMGMKVVDLQANVCGLLNRWSNGQSSVLNRYGFERGDYSYRLLPGINTRPPS